MVRRIFDAGLAGNADARRKYESKRAVYITNLEPWIENEIRRLVAGHAKALSPVKSVHKDFRPLVRSAQKATKKPGDSMRS
jgi:hypothetical protein